MFNARNIGRLPITSRPGVDSTAGAGLAPGSLLSPAANPLKSIDKQKLSECGDQQQLAVAGVQSLDNGYQKEIFITRSHSAAQLNRAVNRNSRKFTVPRMF